MLTFSSSSPPLLLNQIAAQSSTLLAQSSSPLACSSRASVYFLPSSLLSEVCTAWATTAARGCLSGRRFGRSNWSVARQRIDGMLTVREAVYYTVQLQLPDSTPVLEKRESVETAMREIGLQDATENKADQRTKRWLKEKS
ncbi:uncharacterized protein LOC115745751 [Rhodamnia argentea]|uniref:Uncharacterized protein LOC115745751 n=1 Tax=Rhodamnia argentea TaxID=178133 RepID=A0ABM3GS52_9MYRT|nr:uncharacterized protein LOC115745751 [Rhodamnia argentea]